MSMSNKRYKNMKDIRELIEENKKDAVAIINKYGGRIDFVDVQHGAVDLDGSFDDDEDDWLGNIDEVNVPIVLMEFDGFPYKDVAVLSVKTNGSDIEVLAYVIDTEMVVGWKSVKKCYFYSENNVFMFIEEFVTEIFGGYKNNAYLCEVD